MAGTFYAVTAIAAPGGGSLLEDPLFQFSILIAIFVLVPYFSERYLRLPGHVGLIAAGYLLGPAFALTPDIFAPETEGYFLTVLASVGLLFLLFEDAHEIELDDFLGVTKQAISFGILAFTLPFVGGLVAGFYFDFSLPATILIAALLGSHALVAIPVLRRLGVLHDEAVATVVGATIVTETVSLIIVTVAVGLAELNVVTVSQMLDSLYGVIGRVVLFALLVSVGLYFALDRLVGREAIQDVRTAFLMLLVSLLAAAELAQLMGVKAIGGAFLVGLVTSHYLLDHRIDIAEEAENSLLFIGHVIFIPSFFVSLGTQLHFAPLAWDLTPLWVTGALLLTLFALKMGAVQVARRMYDYSRDQALTMWSLSIPLLGTTLAGAFIGVQTGLISRALMTAIVGIVVITSLIGPWLTRRFARHLISEGEAAWAGRRAAAGVGRSDGKVMQSLDGRRRASNNRLVLVEDDDMSRDMLSRRLERKGYDVAVATDGQAGVDMTHSEEPDLVLMDMSLPIKDGWTATRELKNDPETAGVPILALTAHATDADREKAFDAGCDDYDTKPVEFNRLLAKIGVLIESRD